MKKKMKYMLSMGICILFVVKTCSGILSEEKVLSGDWDIYGDEIASDETIILNGNLTIHPGGSLTLTNVTLKMNVQSDGQYLIEVKGGGAMSVYDSMVTDGDGDDDTKLPESPENHRFLFWVQEGAEFEMRNSELHECGYEHLFPPNPEIVKYNHAGLLIKADNVLIHHNLLSHNYIGIILYSSSNSSIEYNTVAYSNNDGINLIYSCNNILKHNVEYYNDQDGLYLKYSDWNQISFNTAMCNMACLDPSRPEPFSETNCAAKLLCASCHNTLENCDSYGNFKHGILLDRDSCHNEVRRCTARRNAENGVFIRSSDSNLVEDVTAIENDNGIALESANDNTIKNSLVSNNNQCGIYLTNYSSAEIKNCTISNNDRDGILNEEGSLLVANYNNITGNKGCGIENTDLTVVINAEHNWWGDPSGPSGVGSGEGYRVCTGVNYDNWLEHEALGPVEEKPIIRGIYSTFDFHYDVVELYMRATEDDYSGNVYIVDIFRADQYTSWEDIEILDVPEGWEFIDFGCGIRLTGPLIKCQLIRFTFRVNAEKIPWYIKINVADETHENAGMIISTRWRLYHYYLM